MVGTDRTAYQKAYQEENREAIRVRRVAYHQEHKEHSLAYHKAWCEANPGHWRRYDRRENSRRYRLAHPEEINVINRNRRAKMSGNGGQHTADDVRVIYDNQDGLCFWCDCELGDKFHIDHLQPIVLGGSNGSGNLVVSCPTCNRSKGAMDPLEFLEKVA